MPTHTHYVRPKTWDELEADCIRDCEGLGGNQDYQRHGVHSVIRWLKNNLPPLSECVQAAKREGQPTEAVNS